MTFLDLLYSMICSIVMWSASISTMSVYLFVSCTAVFMKTALQDTLSSSMVWLVGGILIASFLSSEMTNYSKISWWSMLLILMIGFMSLSMFKYYLMFELSLIPIMILILSFGSQPERLSASAYLIFYTTSLSVPYLVFLMTLSNYSVLFWVPSIWSAISGSSLLFMLPFLVKMPVFGLHFWLPKAHVEANTSGSMVLAGLLLKLGSYGVVRSFCIIPLKGAMSTMGILWVVASFLSSIITFMQSDVKKLVAYSSITHMTFMMVALFTSSKFLLIVAILVALSHGWVASSMFNLMGTVSQSSGTRASHLVESEMGMNWLMLIFGVLLASNASIPPSLSFFPEVLIVLNLMSSNFPLILLFVFMSLSICYYNAFLYIISAHKKSMSILNSKTKFVSSWLLNSLFLLSIMSLSWLNMF